MSRKLIREMSRWENCRYEVEVEPNVRGIEIHTFATKAGALAFMDEQRKCGYSTKLYKIGNDDA